MKNSRFETKERVYFGRNRVRFMGANLIPQNEYNPRGIAGTNQELKRNTLALLQNPYVKPSQFSPRSAIFLLF